MTQKSISQGWEWFADQEKNAENDELKQEIRELHKCYETCFATVEGQIVLKDLHKRFVAPTCFEGYYPDGMNTAIAMARRTAQQDLVIKLETMKKPRGSNDKEEK